MRTKLPDQAVDTRAKVKNDGAPRLPSERDESPDDQRGVQRDDIAQAASDLEQGLVDTDLHGLRGVEKTVQPQARSGQARPAGRARTRGQK